MNAADKLKALESYFALMNMNGASRIYRTANELGVFEAVGPGPATPAELAKASGLREGPLRLLLDAQSIEFGQVLDGYRQVGSHFSTFSRDIR